MATLRELEIVAKELIGARDDLWTLLMEIPGVKHVIEWKIQEAVEIERNKHLKKFRRP